MVVPGSVQWDAQAVDLRFRITDGIKEVAVHSRGAPPQMFRDSMGVVVEGTYGRDGVFQSKNLMVKHSNEYRPPKEGHKPAEVYKTLTKERGT
jgi:cytochrome c-type biogenesis protein CcmE